MAKPTVNIIGTGRVGQSLAYAVCHQLEHTLSFLYSRQQHNAYACAKWVGAGTPTHNLNEIRPADITFITTRDDAIKNVCEQLVSKGGINGGLVCHMSGVLPASELIAAKKTHALIASMHPVNSFSQKPSGEYLSNITFSIEGDHEALPHLQRLVEALGSHSITLSAEAKIDYHISQVFASNYLVALMQCAFDCAKDAGIDEHNAKQMLKPLVQQTLDNIFEQSPEHALTGPIARQDQAVIIAQLNHLAKNQNRQQLYQQLGKKALDISITQAPTVIQRRLAELFCLQSELDPMD